MLGHVHNCLKELKLLGEHLVSALLKISTGPSRLDLTGLSSLLLKAAASKVDFNNRLLVAVVVEFLNFS